VRLELLAAALGATLAALPARALDGAVSLAADGKQPRVAVGAGGLVAAVYGQGDEVFCRVSRDGGLSYAPPARVGGVEKLMLGMRRGPQVAVAGSGLVVTAIGRAGSLVSWRSGDSGRSWTGPATVNDSPASAREGLHALAAGARGAAHVVWLDLRDGRTKVFASRSADGGRTWEANRLVYESPDGAVCECCQPTVAADAKGALAVMWRNSLSGARDMYLARSDDGGRSFSQALKLGTGTWPLRACPMDGGGIAVDGGRVATAWRREDVVYAAEPGAEEKPLGRGRNASVALRDGVALVAWQTSDGDVALARGGSAAPAVVGRGRFPALGAAPDGKGPVVLAWEDPERGAMVLPIAGQRAGGSAGSGLR
jgi:hypothetical protein